MDSAIASGGRATFPTARDGGDLPRGMNEQVRPAPPRRGNTLRSWRLGTAVLGWVVLFSLHWSEERDFAGLLHHARPASLLLATLLQALTYLDQGGVWNVV